MFRRGEGVGSVARRSTGPILAGALVPVLLAGCGSGGPAGAASGSTTTAAAPATTTAPSTTAAAPTTAGAGSSAFLTAWGATVAAWGTNHQPDPDRSGGWWPRLPDNRDTYEALDVVAGRVVGYTLALDPAVSAADAETRLANDLPLDVTKALDRTLPGCEQLVETSPTLTEATGDRVLVELRSSGASYQASSVSTIVTSALARSATPPAAC